MQQTNQLTSDEQKEHEKATYCHICKKVFGANKKHRKVYDYDYYTGNYRGAAHSICNLVYSSQKDIPVFLQNGSNYDFNLIIVELAKEFRSELQCIPVNTNKYMSFSRPIYSNTSSSKKKYVTYNLKFIDSARHMNDSLERLVDNLSEINKCKCDDESLKNIKVTYGKFNNRKIIPTTYKTCKHVKINSITS